MPRVKQPPKTRIKPSPIIRRLLERDPAQRLLDQVELVQGKATLKTLLEVVRRTRKHRVKRGWIHVSDANIPCDRLLAGALLGTPLPRRFIPPRTRRIFDNGTYMHLRYQSYFLCLPEPFKVEVAKMLKRWPIIGEADIRVQHPDIGKWVVELKTINPFQYKNLSAPMDSHIDQVNDYVGMSGGSYGGQFWYESKGDQDLKLYTREFDPSEWEKVWRRTSDIAGTVLTGRLPRVCPTCPDTEFCEDDICVTEKRLEVLKNARATTPRR